MFFFDTTGFLAGSITGISPVLCRCTLECTMIVVKDNDGNPIAQVPFMGNEDQEKNLFISSGIVGENDEIDFFNPISPGVKIQPIGKFYDLIKNPKAAEEIKEKIKEMGLFLVSVYVRDLGRSKNDVGAYKTALIPYTSDPNKFLSFCPVIHSVNSSSIAYWKAGQGIEWDSIDPDIEINTGLFLDEKSFQKTVRLLNRGDLIKHVKK